MRQKRLKSDAREFDAEEKLRLTDYFLADCSGAEDSQVEDIVGGFEANYPGYVEQFVRILNKKGSEYTNPPRIVRKLWAAGSLRKCQLLPAYAYAFFCMNRSSIESGFSSWLKQVASTMHATQEVQRALKQLGATLQQQASCVDASFVGPGAKSPQLMTLAHASDCIQAIDDMERIQTRGVCVPTFTGQLSVLYRMARDQALGVDHPEHAGASAADLADILPLLEQSITGSFPSRNYLIDYSPGNLLKDVSRMREEETIDRIRSLTQKFERIMPGFRERIAFEPFEAIPKRPLRAQLPIDTTEVLNLRSTVAGALSRQLDKVDLFLALTPEANMLLQRSARAHHASPSQIVSLVIEACGGLLRHTMSEALRYSMPAVRPVEAQASSAKGADDPAQDFKARLLERVDHRFPVVRVRRHFSVSRETKRLLGMVAAHHDSNMTRIVETLLILGLSDPNIEPERNVKPDHRR